MKTSAKSPLGRDDMDVFNILHQPIWVFDILNKRMWWANAAALQLWGAATLEDLLARDFAVDMSPATHSRLRDQMERTKEGQVFKEQWTLYPNGKATTVETVISAIEIEDGRGATIIEAQLPDGKKAFDDSLTRGIELLRHVPVAVCQFSIEGHYLYRNPEDLLTFGSTTSTSTSVSVAHHSERDAFVARFVNRSVATRTFQQVQQGVEVSVEAEQWVSKGSSRWFAVSLRRGQDPVSGVFVIICSARDITEIIQAREDTTLAQLKSETLSVVAHELRTPLHQVIGYTDLLELTVLTDFQAESVKLIQQSTELLMVIINDLLHFSKLESGTTKAELVHFPLEGVLRGCTSTVAREASLKGLALNANISGDLPADVVGDPNKIRQILLNLLRNAVKFTAMGGVTLNVFLLNTSSTSCRVRFEVSDTGIGIGTQDQQLIFARYRQANMATTRKYGGTGLGLSICKSLVDLMGGKIGLESTIGKGSTFSVELALDLPEEQTPKLNTGDLRLLSLSGQPLRILVVEDNKVSRRMAQKIVQQMGHTALLAEDGQIALDVLAVESVDLILMDVQMPVMDGIEASRQIRHVLGESKQSLPIVGLTASFQHSDMPMYLDIGMNTCLSKPVRLETLRRTIDAVVSRCALGLYA